jgi:hypothetical protein
MKEAGQMKCPKNMGSKRITKGVMKVSTKVEKNKEREDSLGTLEQFMKEPLQKDCSVARAD